MRWVLLTFMGFDGEVSIRAIVPKVWYLGIDWAVVVHRLDHMVGLR